MQTFFQGWRRKTGVVTLGMACVVMGMWIRSIARLDDLEFSSIGQRQYLIYSWNSKVTLVSWRPEAAFLTGLSFRFHHAPPEAYVDRLTKTLADLGNSGIPSREFSIPYWTVALPLALLSAYLLLWKPRKRDTPKA